MKKFVLIFALPLLVLAACACNGESDREYPDYGIEIEAEATPGPEIIPEPEPEETEVIELDPDAISFETGYYGFTGRGSGVVSRTDEVARAGDYSLLVTGRTASWNGIAIDVTGISEPYGEYEFSLWVMPTEEAGATTFQLSAEFNLDGSPTWRHFSGPIASVRARPGEWTQLRGLLPFYGFDTASVYIETDDGGATADFFIDDVIFRSVAVEYAFDPDLPRLFEVYADYFLFGTAVVPRDMRGERLEFIRHHFNTITAGNDMKPDALQPHRGVFTWDVADEIVRETLDSDMYMIGHTLAWHAQSPAWMNPAGISREDAIENLETHIYEVVSRYRGQVLVWDVVNEAFPSSIASGVHPEVWRAALRPTPWLDAIGYEFIEIAFRAAHAADPNAILIYNDYNLDNPRKREAVFHMAQELLERGVPIHGIGMQGHYNLRTNPQDVEDSILRFAELGILVSITELDITAQGALGYDVMPEQYELQQAILYARLFQIFREHSDLIHRVTLWGLDDATSWRADRFPLPFNRDLSPKMSFHAIADPEGFLRAQGLIESPSEGNNGEVLGINLTSLSQQLNADPSPSADFNRRRDGVEYGEIETLEYFSNTTGATRRVNVYTPPGFDPNRTYPVLYLLHGIGGTHTEWMGGNPNEILSNLIAGGNAAPMIVVMPNVRARYDDSGAGGHFSEENLAAFDNFINDLRDDLMPFIEENFPVTHNRSETAIAGLSMGGRVALQIAASMPEAFMYIGAFSSAPGLLITDDGSAHAGLLNPEQLTLPAEFVDNTFILLNNGDNEEMFERMTLLYYNTLVENGVTPVHYVTPGGHDFSVWRNGLYHFARNIFSSQ